MSNEKRSHEESTQKSWLNFLKKRSVTPDSLW